MPRRSLSDLRYALRRRARRGRYALEDLGYAVRRSTRRLSSGTGRRWSGLTLRTRHRIVAAVAATVVLVALAVFAVPNLPCQLPGGSECQPDDEAIALVPGDAAAYVHVDTDRDTEQYERAASIAERIPAVSEQVIARLPEPDAARIDYRRDVAPWLGGEAALALIPVGGGDPRTTALLEVGDRDGAARFVERLTGPRSKTEPHRGVDVVGDGSLAAATVGDFVVVGREEQVRSVIDAEAGAPPLADAEWVHELRDGFPEPRLAELLVSEAGADELFAPRGPLGSFEAFVNARATRGAGAALVATDDGLELDVDSLLDAERVDSAPGFFGAFPSFEPELSGEPSENALAYLALGDPASSVAGLFTQATAESPGLAAGFEDFARRLRKAGGVNLERELLPLLSSQAAVWVEPRGGRGEAAAPESELPGPEGAPQAPGDAAGSGAPFVTMVVDDVDSERATQALARLQRPIAKALDPDLSLQAPVFDEQRIEGVEAQSLRVSPAVQLTYAVVDGRLVVSTDPAGVRQVLSDDSGLEGSDRFEAATEGLPDDVAAFGYLNLDGLLQLAEQAGLGADPAYATFGEELRRLEAVGVAVRQDDNEIDTELRLTVGG